MDEDKKLEQEDKEEEKEEKKEAAKKGITFVAAGAASAFLFILILLLLTLLCLKKCDTKTHSSISSSGQSSQGYNYNNQKLDEIFKKIVINQMSTSLGDDTPITDIVSVTYNDTGNEFSLYIDARSASDIYYYQVLNKSYGGHANFVSYLLDLNTEVALPFENTQIELIPLTNDVITNPESNHYVISEKTTTKYLSGFSFTNNEYHVYHKEVLTGLESFPNTPTQILPASDPLFGYYQELDK